MQEFVIINTDGGSRGNPGPAAAAFVITDKQNTQLAAKAFFLGKATNNVAEYTGLLKALDCAKSLGFKNVLIRSDSELMVRQLKGEYKVKSPGLIDLYSGVMQLLSGFTWRIEHVFREQNTIADELANRAMDLKQDVEQAKKQPKTRPVRIGILLSGGGRTMVNINEKIEACQLNAQIVTVISSRSNVAGVDKAKTAGFPTHVIRRKDFEDIEAFSAALAAVLLAAKVDLVVQAGWLCLWHIPKQLEYQVINIHPALLPSFGGQGMWGHHVHEAVLAAGCKVSGCTVHFCTNEYDKGPIIVQRCCPARDDDTADTLAERVFEQECIAYPEAIELFAQRRLKVSGNIVKVQ